MRSFTSLSTALLAALFALAVAGCGGDGKGSPEVFVERPPLGAPDPDGPIDYADLPAGSFALTLLNQTQGYQPDERIFVTIVGVDPDGQFHYVRPSDRQVTGTSDVIPGPLAVIHSASMADNQCDADGSHCHVDYAFTLGDMGEHKTIYLPGSGHYASYRITISMRQALIQQFVANGLTPPDITSSQDVNAQTAFDTVTFSYDPQSQPAQPFSGATSQIDQFGIPLLFTVTGVDGTSIARGIQVGPGSPNARPFATRADLLTHFDQEVRAPFHCVASNCSPTSARLLSPLHLLSNFSDGTNAAYFDTEIDAALTNAGGLAPASKLDAQDELGNGYHACFATDPTPPAGSFCFRFTQAGSNQSSGPFHFGKPTAQGVLTGQMGCISDNDACPGFARVLSAALNRGVAGQPNFWSRSQQYYTQDPSNEWAAFWHHANLYARAYAMPFEDVNDQGSMASLPAGEDLRQLTIVISW